MDDRRYINPLKPVGRPNEMSPPPSNEVNLFPQMAGNEYKAQQASNVPVQRSRLKPRPSKVLSRDFVKKKCRSRNSLTCVFCADSLVSGRDAARSDCGLGCAIWWTAVLGNFQSSWFWSDCSVGSVNRVVLGGYVIFRWRLLIHEGYSSSCHDGCRPETGCFSWRWLLFQVKYRVSIT